jgi:hypothetical protein
MSREIFLAALCVSFAFFALKKAPRIIKAAITSDAAFV